MDSLQKHQSLYKAQSPHWKATYRKRCQDRLRKSRDKFLDRFRQTGCGSHNETVDQVMAEEWQAMNNNSVLQPSAGDQAAPSFESDLGIFEEIRAELIREEQQILAEYESSLQFEESACQSSMDDKLMCPVCQKNPLMKNKSVIFCYCGVRIDTETDCMTLDMVRENLANGVKEHSNTCPGQPRFSFSDFSGIGMHNILMTCGECPLMFIVV